MKKIAAQWKLLDIEAHFIPLSSFTIKDSQCIFTCQYSPSIVELHKICPTKEKEQIIRKILADVSQALHYLHESGFVFLNLNLHTIMMRVGETGPSCYLTDCTHMKRIGKVAIFDPTVPFDTFVYAHPDLIGKLDVKYYAEVKIDAWALGVLAYFLFTGEYFVVSGKKLELVKFYKQQQHSINLYLQKQLTHRPKVLMMLQKLFQQEISLEDGNQKEN